MKQNLSNRNFSNSSEVEGQNEWLWRVTKGQQGLPAGEKQSGKSQQQKATDDSMYSGGGFAVLGNEQEATVLYQRQLKKLCMVAVVKVQEITGSWMTVCDGDVDHDVITEVPLAEKVSFFAAATNSTMSLNLIKRISTFYYK